MLDFTGTVTYYEVFRPYNLLYLEVGWSYVTNVSSEN